MLKYIFLKNNNILLNFDFSLICSVGYVRCDGEKKEFKKYYQFEVEQPLQMSSKTHLVNVSFIFYFFNIFI